MKRKGVESEKGQRPWFKKRQEELESTRASGEASKSKTGGRR